jgi:outer membrane protein assembly factor BamB
MKHLFRKVAVLAAVMLAACSPAAVEETEAPGVTEAAPTETEAPMEAEMEAEEMGTLVEDPADLVGTWFAPGGGGWMILREDGSYRGAVRKDELINSEPGDTTFWRGTYQVENGQFIFMERSQRCGSEEVGIYQVYRMEDGALHFEVVEDPCDMRINGFLGQRTEAVIDLVWQKSADEAPYSVDWFRTIELPFIAHDIDVDPEGNIYVIELGEPMVHKVDRDGNVLASWGGQGDAPGEFAFAPPPDGPQLDGGFVAVDPSGRVYISDSYNNRVQIFNASGELEGIWDADSPEGAPFDVPGPISADAAGNIYVADFEGVHQFDPDGEYVRSIQAAGELGFNSKGDLFTVVNFEHFAMKIPADGGEPLMWGSEGPGDGQFIAPLWVEVRPDDTVYIGDHSGRVQRFNSQGELLTVWAGEETEEGPFMAPTAISMGADGDIYVASKGRPKIYVLSQ